MKRPALLVLPGGDDEAWRRFDLLNAQLAPDGWVCSLAHIPDAR